MRAAQSPPILAENLLGGIVGGLRRSNWGLPVAVMGGVS